MEPFNYFNYFTEIEEHFWRKRGAHLLVSPLDWAIVETWQKAGIPLNAVLKGIDRAFESWSRSRRAAGGRTAGVRGSAAVRRAPCVRSAARRPARIRVKGRGRVCRCLSLSQGRVGKSEKASTDDRCGRDRPARPPCETVEARSC